MSRLTHDLALLFSFEVMDRSLEKVAYKTNTKGKTTVEVERITECDTVHLPIQGKYEFRAEGIVRDTSKQ